MRLTAIAAFAAAGVFAPSTVAYAAAPSPLPLLRPPGAGAPGPLRRALRALRPLS